MRSQTLWLALLLAPGCGLRDGILNLQERADDLELGAADLNGRVGNPTDDDVKHLFARVQELQQNLDDLRTDHEVLKSAHEQLKSDVIWTKSATDIKALDKLLSVSGDQVDLAGSLALTGGLEVALVVEAAEGQFDTVGTATLQGTMKTWNQNAGDKNGERLFSADESAVYMVIAEARKIGSEDRGQTWMVYRTDRSTCTVHALGGPGTFGLNCDGADGSVTFGGGSGSPYTHINWFKLDGR